ncbi:MAG TPA: 50S ribosomal protein L21 [Candidatus Dormibacteraeota bacterium]
MPQPEGSLSAIVVSGGKQYRVAPGDRILVDRLAAETGSELTLDRVLMLADGDDVKVGLPAVEGATVLARVIGPTKGPKIDVLRYKSKKRVRVHRGARAYLTAIEILQVGGKPARKTAAAEDTEAEAETRPKKAAAKPKAPAKPRVAKKPVAEKEETDGA